MQLKRRPVTFDMNVYVLNMFVWSYAYRVARIGTWQQDAADRERFEKRITELEKIISPVLTAEHRKRIQFSFVSQLGDSVL